MEQNDTDFNIPSLNSDSTEDEWKACAHIGGCYYPIPDAIKSYIPKTLELAYSLPQQQGSLGYSREEKQQIEILCLEKYTWHHFNNETQILAKGMAEIGRSIVLNILRSLNIDPSLYKEATGGLSHNEGKIHFKLAHYDAAKNYPGLPWHKDIRWVTVLYINQNGLQGKHNEHVFDISPREGYFVINLGVFFEAFINDTNKLNALIHQVRQVTEDRVSFGAFCEGNYDKKGFWQLDKQGIVWKEPEFMNLVKDDTNSFSMTTHRIFNN
jgi:hypothetical protein